jgi:hypothetical protein
LCCSFCFCGTNRRALSSVGFFFCLFLAFCFFFWLGLLSWFVVFGGGCFACLLSYLQCYVVNHPYH